jgi:cytochrome c556
MRNAVFALAVLTGCAGSGSSTTANAPTAEPQPSQLDKVMRTKMNASYSRLMYLVFHAEGDPDFASIAKEGAALSDAVRDVLSLPVPAVAQSEQGRAVYLDYNNALKRDNERLVEATAQKDIASISTSLTKIGETCSACHNFFRVEIEPPK